MPLNHRFWAVVPAAGAGLRFGGGLPKQYALLADKPVLAHSLKALTNTPAISRIVIALDPEDKCYDARQLPAGVALQTVQGGSSRAASVLNALQALQANADANDWVLVHDAARPLLTTKMLSAMIECLSNDPVGGILAQRAHDTVKLAASTKAEYDNAPVQVARTLDRDAVWLAQTPQMFRFGLLRDALQAALHGPDAAAVTDEASAIEQAGLAVRLVANDAPNIKITTPADLALAEYYLAAITQPGSEPL